MRRLRSLGIRLVMLFGVLFLVYQAPVSADSSVLAGEWEGAIEVPGQQLGVVFRFSDEGAVGDIPAQYAFNLAVKDLVLDGTAVSFAYADIPATYEGEISEDGNSISGVYTQGPVSFPFSLTRKASAVVDEDQIAAIESMIRDTLEQWNVAGAAVSIVKDGQTILAEGFGLRDVEQGLATDADTLFGIGSSTKAFTTALFQTFVEDGALAWDAPVQATLPHLKLYDPWVAENITARDFALHRSGLPRHDSPWMFNPDLDMDAFLAAGDTLDSTAPFRTTWQYNNLGYAIIGRMVEEAAGTSWEEAVTTRLLGPIGMESTNFTVDAMLQTGNYAKTYAHDGSEYISIELQDLGAIKAAGAINSSANDMAQWLHFLLGQGKMDGIELVSAAGMRDMQSGQIAAPASMPGPEIRYSSYGLGWFTDDYRGHRRAEHGGNTLGYSADVAVLPESGIGVAVLTNAPGTPVPYIVVNQVLDTLLELEPIDWNARIQVQVEAQAAAMSGAQNVGHRRDGTSPSHDLSEYTGTYTHPAYGDVVVERTDDGLQAVYYTTTIPLEHWHYDQFRGPLNEHVPIQVPFLFVTNERGEIGSVAIGLEPTLSPIPFIRKPDQRLTDPSFLASLTGTYDFTGLSATISVRGTNLVLSVAGQVIVFEPVSGTLFQMADLPIVTLEFELDSATGTVAKAVLTQPTGPVEMLPID